MMRNQILISCLMIVLLVVSGCVTNAPTRGVYHTVERGQTLYTISKIYGVEEIYLARINKITDPTQLRVGARIYIPGATQVLHVPATVAQNPPGTPETPETPVTPVTPPHVTYRPPPRIDPPRVKEPTPSRPEFVNPDKPLPPARPSAGKGTFIWPVKGTLVKKFNRGTAVGSKGIEVSVNSGTPVSSAAAGKVIYSGDGISGYGNLLIIRHDDSFFTVYGYNKKNLVQAGAFVSKGEKIALSGQPPSGGKPRVYFEIRYGKKPVDPLLYLP